jgi:hypothetical protein
MLNVLVEHCQWMRNRFFKLVGICLTGLLSVAVTSVCVVMIAGLYKMYSRSAPVPNLKVAGSPEQIQRGQAIANSFCGG